MHTSFSGLSPITLGLALIAASSSSLLTYTLFGRRQGNCISTLPDWAELPAEEPPRPLSLVGAPAQRFRDNLRNDTSYITSWADSGWTNDVMAIGNLLYIALLTGRTPILPPFAPVHIGRDASLIRFSDVFDLGALSANMGTDIIEWADVKDPKSDYTEPLGCWSIWENAHNAVAAIGASKLDISYTTAPSWTHMGQNDHALAWKLARLSDSSGRSRALPATHRPSPQLGASLPPNEHLLCFDYTYWVGVDEPFEWEKEWSPVWRAVGRHMRWSPALEKIAEGYLRDVFEVGDSAEVPYFIVIHARQGDFKQYCNTPQHSTCFVTVSTWADEVALLRERLKAEKGINAREVVMTSDETDELWWEEAYALGWKRLDHPKMRTVERYGRWYPVLIDAVVQSSGAGFLGTAGSTMSLVALRRTEEWTGGIGNLVKW